MMIAGTLVATAPDRQVRVVGYLRSVVWTPGQWSRHEHLLTVAAYVHGHTLVEVVRSDQVSTFLGSCGGITHILDLLARREVDGVIALADYGFAWDREVVARITERIREHGGFIDYLYPRLLRGEAP